MHPAEKRKTIRRSIRYPGCIELDDDRAPIQCTLCDASQEGAQLVVDDPKQLPDQFLLVLGYDGTARRLCHVMWRTETQVGVEFIKQPAAEQRRAPAAAGTRSEANNDSFDIDSLPVR